MKAETRVWCSPEEKAFVIGWMGRQGWIFKDSVPGECRSLEMRFERAIPRTPETEEAVLQTLCGCSQVVHVPYRCLDYLVPLALNATEFTSRKFRRKACPDEYGRPVYEEVWCDAG